MSLRISTPSPAVVHTLRIANWHPLTINQLLGQHWATRGRAKKADATLIALLCHEQGIPIAASRRRVGLHLVMGPRQRRPDPDSSFKALLDALVKAGRLVDDGPVWCELLPLTYSRGKEKACVVTLEEVP